jgi:hypothetical protein
MTVALVTEPDVAGYNSRHGNAKQCHAYEKSNKRFCRYEHIENCSDANQNPGCGQCGDYRDQLIPTM